ncbi:MAG: FG-GAP-like repeat-containing protein, partial [bacterium]
LNNDGLPDIVYAGMNSSYRKESYIIINQGNWSFENRASDLPGIRAGKIEVADVNNDGYIDIALFGNDNDDNYLLKIFKNVYGSAFTLISEMQGIVNGDIHFGDFNMSGYPDLLVTGKKQSGEYQSTLYENNSGLSFTETGFPITDITNAASRWFDFNNNSKLDFIISGNKMAGPVTELYANNTELSNHKPETPANLMHNSNQDTIILQWDAPLDNEQPSEGLSYDVWIVDKTNSRFIFIPPADTVNGKRKVVKHGLFTDTSCSISLPEGKYFWSVQAIDQAFEGSLFAPADSFVICFPISAGNDTAVCYGEQVTLSVDDVDGTADWYSAKNPATPFSTDKSVEIQVLESDTIWVDVTKDFGTVVSDTVIITMNPLPVAELGDNKYLCPGDILNLSAGTENDVVNWSTLSGNYSESDTNSFVYSFFNDDVIFVQLTDSNGCTGYDTLAVFMNDIPQISLVNDTAICKFDTIQLTPDNINDSINWYSFQQELILANSTSIERYIDKTDTLIIEAYNNLQCTNYDTIIIRARELPVADAGEDKLICEGYDVVIGPESPNENYNYLWSPNEHIDDIYLANPMVNPVVDSKYYVEVADQFGCTSTDSVFVQINPPGVFNIGPDTSICPGGSVMLGGNPTAEGSILPYAYEWSPTASLSGFTTANSVAFPDKTTKYTLIIYTGECPVDTLETTVTVHPLPEISIMNDTLAGFEEDISLWADGGVEYEWNPAEFLDNPYIQNPVANLDQTTNFTVQVTNTYGCSDTAGVKIMVKNELFIHDLLMGKIRVL